MSDNQLKLNEQLFNVVLGKNNSLDVMLKKVKYLVRLGADLNANKKGDTLLFWAKKNNVSDEVIRVLEDMGAVSCSKTKEERVALARKCLDENKKFKSIEEVNFFIDEGADVNALDDKGECLLILAARMERNDVFKVLLDNGADIEAKSKNGGFSALGIAIDCGNADMVKMLIEKGADLELRTKEGFTPLIVASYLGYDEIVGLLLKANVNKNAVDNMGMSALMNAAFNGHKGVVQKLIDYDVDVNYTNKKGIGALDCARTSEFYSIAEMIENKAKMNKKQNNGGFWAKIWGRD